MLVEHGFDPVYDNNSKVLILGSIPSVKSRENGFYYMHPKNRFWKIIGLVFNEEVGQTIDEKIKFLNKHHVALYDVVKSCEISSSSDSSIKKVKVNDFSKIIKEAKIKKIFVTGRKAEQLYNKYCFEKTKMEAIYLPSTSPANCSKGIEEFLVSKYEIIKEYTE